MLQDAPFPQWIRFAEVDQDVLREERPHSEELACLSPSAVTKRRNEFSMGRIATRRALSLLGVEPMPILSGVDRAPTWPAGVVGSITHTRDYAAAAVASTAHCLALGIDVEPLRALREEISTQIADEQERLWVGSDGARALALFSAKEAVFKAFYPFKRAYFGFDAVRLEATSEGFHATLRMTLGQFTSGYRFFVHAGRKSGGVWSAVWLPREEARAPGVT